MRHLYLTILMLMLVFGPLSAQKTQIGIYYNNYKASESFDKNITRNPIGVAFTYLKEWQKSLFVGVELGLGLYSGKKYFYETVDEGVPGNIERLYEENGFFSYQLALKYLLVENDIITPYIEVKTGASTFFSAIRTMQVSDVYQDDFYTHDTALNVGAGGGVTIAMGGPSWRRNILLDLAASHQWGSQVRYRNSIKNEQVDNFNHGYRSSKTNATHYKIGFILVY